MKREERPIRANGLGDILQGRFAIIVVALVVVNATSIEQAFDREAPHEPPPPSRPRIHSMDLHSDLLP